MDKPLPFVANVYEDRKKARSNCIVPYSTQDTFTSSHFATQQQHG